MNIEAFKGQDSANHDPSPQGSGEQDTVGQGMHEYLTNGYDYQAPKRGDIRTGVIIDTNESGLVVDVGFKREGLVPAEDLERLDEETRAEIRTGMEVPVYILRPEDKEGRPILSIFQARLFEDWLKAEEMMESGELYEGEVAGFNRGGLIVRFGKIRGFIPASQIVGLPRRLREDQRRQRLEAMIGQKVGLRIIEVDRHRRRLIFSQRRALRAWQEMQRERVMAELTEGETRHGQVTSITNFGAFVDLGGADGLIHVSELSHRRVEHPREVLKVGDEVDVYVLDVDRDRKRIALSLKKLLPDPWSLVDDEYRIGELIEGRVTRVLDFGAFIELDLGIEGLLHASEMIGTPELPPSEIVSPGEKLLVKIIRIESRRRRLALSARQVRRSEWERWVAEQQQVHEEEEAEETAAELEAASPEAEEVVAEAETTSPEAEEIVAEAETTSPEAEEDVAEAETTSPEAEEDVAEAEAAPQEAEETVAEAEAAPPEAEEAVGEAETAPPKTGEAADEAVGALPEAEETAIETASPVPEAADSALEADSEATEELPSESEPALAAAEPAHNEEEAVAADAAEEEAEVQLVE